MSFTRRSFLHRISAGAAAATVLQFPVAEQLAAQSRRAPAPAGAIRLNANENAYGPLPSALKAMSEALGSNANRYPFYQYSQLLSRIAAYHRIQPEQIIIGAGSSEPIFLAAKTFCAKGKNVVVADPTFELLGDVASQLGAEVRKVPLTPSFAHDFDAMLARIDADTALVYICNPNNPTASLTPSGDIETFLTKVPDTAVVLIDEAYHHFADGLPGYRSFVDRASDRILVTRTFSKIYGMAGMRLGYSVSSPALAQKISAFQQPTSVNTIVCSGGIASLEADGEMKFAAHRNASDRAEFMKQAAARKLEVIPSAANFAMMKTGKPAQDIIDAFRQRNVLIGRPFPPMLEYIRVSFGLPEENKAFWQVWDQIHT